MAASWIVSLFLIVGGSNVFIVDGPNQFEGRIEVIINGTRGLVCDDNWDDDDAEVACQEIGLSGNSQKDNYKKQP